MRGAARKSARRERKLGRASIAGKSLTPRPLCVTDAKTWGPYRRSSPVTVAFALPIQVETSNAEAHVYTYAQVGHTGRPRREYARTHASTAAEPLNWK